MSIKEEIYKKQYRELKRQMAKAHYEKGEPEDLSELDEYRGKFFPGMPQEIPDETEETVDPWDGKDRDFRFNEIEYLREIEDYIVKTYGGHYSRKKFQATEFIYDGGHGTGFNIGNVLKYAQRYGKKGTRDDARKDLMKVIHYAILQLHVHDKEL